MNPPTDPIRGELVRAGTFPVYAESVPGLHIVLTMEELRAIKHLPMKRRVVVLPEEQFDALKAASSFARFQRVLIAHGIIHAGALSDPEGYDNYRTRDAVHAAYQEMIAP